MSGEHVSDAVALLREGQVSSEELTHAALARIEQTDAKLNAYLAVTAEIALAQARAADQRRAAGDRVGPLLGVPFSLKDNIDTSGVPTTCGSGFLRDRVPDADASVVRRLRAAGAVMVGKVNLHEFAWGGSTENEHFGPTRNPWDLTRNAAGSSGGSGAAVAADTCTFSLGTDTGGSIRLPASANGVTGLRPTVGLISDDGVFPLAWSMDTVGPLARSARDIALVLRAIEGPEGVGPAAEAHRRSEPDVPHDLTGRVIGWDEEFASGGCLPGVLAALKAALGEMESLGAKIVPVSLPDTELVQKAWSVIHIAEPAAVHRELLRKHADEYGADVRALLQLGELLPATDYIQAQRFRSAVRSRTWAALRGVDVLALPTAGWIPSVLGRNPLDAVRDLTGVTTGLRFYTCFASMLAAPALTIPVGFAEELPVGLQLVGRPFEDSTLLAAGEVFQNHTDWHLRRPPV
ncbi:Asp-tRNA(Asn)/Glu-tRNA(Gln) amidotransferase subunit GatA [Kribbella yunnanensis]|uniref:Asp-tRNA(Asn)/Glu-tRNA(Gln) amidotransferase subunit GatA n=1 Tax=Kribbella yunnanensis TaxID=190194 RepID=A0ABP4UMD6_9ACTN